MRTAAFEMHDEISIHAPHEGERQCRRRPHLQTDLDFNPRSPRGGATGRAPGRGAAALGISIHAPHEGERPASIRYSPIADASISIHAPHEGERLGNTAFFDVVVGISIHAPHEGERQLLPCVFILLSYFNPRSPRGGATEAPADVSDMSIISIHAPHEGERLTHPRPRKAPI